MTKKEKKIHKQRLLEEFYNSPMGFWDAARVLTFWPEPLFNVKSYREMKHEKENN